MSKRSRHESGKGTVATGEKTRTRKKGKSTSSTPKVDIQQAVERAMEKAHKKKAHFVDLALAGRACDTTGSIALIATMAQGASQSQRVGKRAQYKSLQMRGQIQVGTTTTITDATVLIVYDRKPTGLLPGITDILNTVSSNSFNNDVNAGRFKIVRRFDYALAGNITTPATGMEVVNADEYIDLRNMEVEFGNLATGAIGDITKGALYVVTCGITAAGTAAATANLGFRTRFFDLEG